MVGVEELLDPEVSLKLIKALSWVLILLSLAKLLLYAIGEWAPSVYSRIKSDAVKKVITGKGNRLLFGLGGILFLLFGIACLALAYFIEYLLSLPT